MRYYQLTNVINAQMECAFVLSCLISKRVQYIRVEYDGTGGLIYHCLVKGERECKEKSIVVENTVIGELEW